METQQDDKNIPTQFNHSEVERKIYALWEREHVFEAKVDSARKPFCVVIPPPNVTGILHMGHVLDNVPQDVMTRWHRMRGFAALWVPGTDHAGIATQNVVKKSLEKEGINFRQLGREEFTRRVWQWREKHGGIIIEQLKRLGCSCDWARERFTMDAQLSKAVLKAFVHYFEKGLIYKGKRMINWCTVCGTALANDEVEHEEKDSHLWHFRYPILSADGTKTGNFVTVATTRPETMLGDTAVAVHPDDERYRELVGKNVLLPLQDRPVPVIADAFVDPGFGTGVVKVTPAHDPNDYQMGQMHGLGVEVVIGLDGSMTAAAGKKYTGQDRFLARKVVVRDLEELGLLDKIEKYRHAVGECYRCNSVVEPVISDQWFVKMKPLAEKAKQAVLDGHIHIVPESEKHDYFHWMDNIQDWCISRQLWWGHRIPVYYCQACSHVMAQIEVPSKCEACGAAEIIQDEDVLDTWFSSQLWPFSTLGWPDKTSDLEFWYPNSWLMSGRDILFFWDARMIMSGLELVGNVPFRTLALHGLVRDERGRKLSKSLGNSPDPLQLFDQYGTDAVRAAMTLRYPMGRQDTKLTGDFYKAGQALITKLWNATRLLMLNAEAIPLDLNPALVGKTFPEDQWIIGRLGASIAAHDDYLAKSDFAHAFEMLTGFFWNEFCDWYLEIIKWRLREPKQKQEALQVALLCERALLKILHPYIPFITEELWQIWRERGLRDVTSTEPETVLALSHWPSSEQFRIDAGIEKLMEGMMSIVRGVRDIRHHLNIAPKLELNGRLFLFDSSARMKIEPVLEMAKNLAFVSSLEFSDEQQTPSGFVPFRFVGGIGYIRLPQEVNPEDLKERLESKIVKLEKALTQAEARLSNPSFLTNAPQELIDDNQRTAQEYKESLVKLREFSSSLL